MKKKYSSWLVALIILLMFTVSQSGTYTSDFNKYLTNNQSKDQVSAVITMADRVDLEALTAELYTRKADRQEWHEAVVRALQEKATESQANLLAKLEEMKKQGQVTDYQNHWLGNLVIVTATADAYNELVQRADVDQIAPDYKVEEIKEVEKHDTPLITSGVESGLSAIRADEVWAMGYTGEGRLVSHLDTGVNVDHEALNSNWRGNDSRYGGHPDWAWNDPVGGIARPYDSSYHGTHTMGTICGLGESTGDTIGVAFGAEWISSSFLGSTTEISLANAISAYEWLADPDGNPSTVWDVPDVCSNSWGIDVNYYDYDPCDETLWEAIDNLEAAGVVVVFSAGNSGGDLETINVPASRATTDLNCFAVGAVNGNVDTYPIAYFSSRGPSYCTEDGSAAIKPEIVAPGIYVRSAYSAGGYVELSGTSMAAPHIAGVVALMRQANPNLSSEQVKQILLNTAVDLGNEGDDNAYGMGMVDAYAAVNMALSYLENYGALVGTITDLDTNEPIAGVNIGAIDRNYAAISRSDGSYCLYLPADTLYDIKVNYSSDYLPIYDQQTVNANETTYVNYTLESKVKATFTVSFANGSEISYRNFYIRGSWDNDGYYDADWSADIIALADDGVSPDETAGDGIFTADVLIARDSEHAYSWKVYTENYGVNSIGDAFLINGSNFNITDLNPVTIPTIAPNPSGSDNNFAFSVEGDNDWTFDLISGAEDTPYLWSGSTTFYANTTYTFTFHVMHGDKAIYGSGGVGGDEITYTPTVDGVYEFTFNDNDDSYMIVLSGYTAGVPTEPGAVSGLDGHVTLSWTAPVSDDSSVVLAGYNLYRGTASAPYDRGLKINSEIITAAEYDDWGTDSYGPIVNGTTYYYQLTAIYDINGVYAEIGPSVEFTGTPVNQAPEAPLNLAGEAGDHTITLTWDTNTDYDIAVYNIYRLYYNADEYELVGMVEHPTAAYTEDITIDGIYYYQIKAVDAEGMESDYSNTVDFAIGLVPPGKTKATTDREFQIQVSWTAPGSDYATTATQGLNAAVLYTSYWDGGEAEVMNYLINNGVVDEYTVFDIRSQAPALSDLEPFDMVFVMPIAVFDADGSRGDVLADYVDLGKPVIAFNPSFIGAYDSGIRGRFMDDYSPFALGYNYGADDQYFNMGSYDESSPIMEGVDSLYTYFINIADVEAQNNGQVVAYWDNGYGLVAYSNDYPIVAVNDYVCSRNSNRGDDMLQLIYNAVKFISGSGYEPDGYKLYKSESENGDYELLATLGSDIRVYNDSPIANGVPYYYQVTALWDDEESAPANTVEGIAVNCAPDAPTSLAAVVDDHAVNLTWAFTDEIGDLDHYNIYRKTYHVSEEWQLVGSSTTESYVDEISDNGAIYKYSVTAIDNGDPQLESDYSDLCVIEIGNMRPNSVRVADYQDGIVPLHWYAPGIIPCTTFVYDNGQTYGGVYSLDYSYRIAKQFTGVAPVQICTVFVRLETYGDDYWPFPDEKHDPAIIQIWDDDGTGRPGSVISETVQTCELGEWLTIGFETPVVCNTDNFWVSWGNAGEGYDAIMLTNSGEYAEHDWYRPSDGVWRNESMAGVDNMIRASIMIDGVAEEIEDGSSTETAEMVGYYIYRSTYPDVPIDDAYLITPEYLTETSYDDTNVSNGTTYYYAIVAAYDNDGTIELSDPSDEVSATPSNPGTLTVDYASIDTTAYSGDIVTVPVTLTNNGGLPVTFLVAADIDDDATLSTADIHPDYIVTSWYTELSEVCEKSDNGDEDTNLPIVTNSGGPDDFGYAWIDSDDEFGPEYNWVDITGIGVQMELTDESNFGPYAMGFNFPFYGISYSTFRVSSNGYISFTSQYVITYENYELPTGAEPFNLVAPFWDDLNPEAGGECYYYVGSDSVIVSWIGIPVYGTDDYCTFQIILTSDGNIVLQYGDIGSDGISATIGIQNADGTIGLCVSYNAEYVHNDMTVRINNNSWLRFGQVDGTVPAGGSLIVNALLDPSMLGTGITHTGTMTITGYDYNHDLDPLEIPITFAVEDTVTGIGDNSGLPTTYSLDQNYPNPFNAHTEIKYALPVDSDVQLEVYNILGQKVVTLVDEEQTAGYHSLIWDGTNESGQVVSSGMYLYKLVTNEDTFVKKMVMLK